MRVSVACLLLLFWAYLCQPAFVIIFYLDAWLCDDYSKQLATILWDFIVSTCVSCGLNTWATADFTSSCVLTLGTDGNRPCYTQGVVVCGSSHAFPFLELSHNMCLVPWQPKVETFVGPAFQIWPKMSLNSVTSLSLLYLSSHLLWHSCLSSSYEWINIIVFVFLLYRVALKRACRRRLEVDCHKNSRGTIGTNGWHGLPLVWAPLWLEHCWADSIRNQFISISLNSTVWNKPESATTTNLLLYTVLSPSSLSLLLMYPSLFLSKLLRNVLNSLWHKTDGWKRLTSWCIKLDGCSNDVLRVCVLNMIVLSDCVQMRVFCKFWGQKVSSPFYPPVSGSGCRWTSVSWGHYRNQETTQLTKWWCAVLFTCPPPRLPD